ncbi:MAG TPA: high-potential iron-sulfur protein [Rhodocyclaceae bacterium]|jgi:hypothetical protein|nr:high-potential iron-sulfur protein [Rhodocyclaceae bacterium]HRQ48135.1 high-potential iron-sulfur protein [Rhodocyclaceae bacterium]
MKTHDPRRRVVLRGALATGCALGVPILLGCKGEQAQSSAPAPAAPSASSAPSTPGAAGGKLSQADARYQNSPNGDAMCGNCLHFVAESNTCRVVDGQVSPSGWCSLWARRG